MTPEIDYQAVSYALAAYIQPDGGLYCLGRYLSWSPGDKQITLDSDFTASELSAIVYWMEHGHKLHPSQAGNAI